MRHTFGPVYEVVGLHQNEAMVVAPAILVLIPLPLCVAESHFLAAEVQVGHGKIESTVRPSVNMRVADAVLRGESIAGHHRPTVVESRKRVSVPAGSHIQAACGILMEHEQIGIILGICGFVLFLCRCMPWQ